MFLFVELYFHIVSILLSNVKKKIGGPEEHFSGWRCILWGEDFKTNGGK
jgi:hypothetical protein